MALAPKVTRRIPPALFGIVCSTAVRDFLRPPLLTVPHSAATSAPPFDWIHRHRC